MSKTNFKGPSANFLHASALASKNNYLKVDEVTPTSETDDFARLHLDTVQRIPIDKLVKFPTNRTYTEENVELLKKDILAEGFTTVIMVAEETKEDPSYTDTPLNEHESSQTRTGKLTGRYIILRGHRRFDALSRALKEDPSISPDGCVSAYVIEPGLSWDRLKELNMTDNHRVESVSLREQRREIAELMKLYKKRGLSDAIERVSQYYDRNKTQIYKSLQISENLNPEFLEEFDHGFIPTNVAVGLSRLSKETQEKALILYKNHGGITEDDIQSFMISDNNDAGTIDKKHQEMAKAQEERKKLQEDIDLYHNGNEKELSESEINAMKKKRDNLTKKIRRLQVCLDELENKPFPENDAEPVAKTINIVSARVTRMSKNIQSNIKFMAKNAASLSTDDVQVIDDMIDALTKFKAQIQQ